MEREYSLTAMVLIILSLIYTSSSVVGAVRPFMMTNDDTIVKHPQNWPGFTFPSPGFAVPTPGYAFPTPAFNFGQPGAGSICILFPTSAGCGQAQPDSNVGSLGGGSFP